MRASRSRLPLALGPGTVLRDRYRLTDTLEVGQVATLYQAEEVETGQTVAVKVFHEVTRNARSQIEIFRRPTPHGAARLELPSAFVAVYECDLTDDGRLFLVTELVKGPSVADLLGRTPPLTPARALELAMRVGEAIEGTLNLGLLNLRMAPRDIVVVGDGDHVKLLGSDALVLRRLGLADQLAPAEAPGRDPRYASPEELAGLPATERSVVYRFGVLLYELLCDSPPFEGTTPAEVRARQLRSLPRRLRDQHRVLPASLDRLVSRMLNPDPVARSVDLTSILNELWDAACGLRADTPAAPMDTASSPASAAPATPVRRRRTRPWALAGLPILIVGGTLLAWPYLVGGPTAPTSASAPVPTAVDVSPPPAQVRPPLPVLLPSDPGTPSGRISTQVPGFHPSPGLPPSAERPPPAPTVDGDGSPARVGANASFLPGATQPESPRAPADAKAVSPTVGPAREPPPTARPTEAPAPRRVATQADPEPTSARANLSPPSQPETAVAPSQPETAVALPPVPPSPPQPESGRAADPAAIIEWLVRESSRIGE